MCRRGVGKDAASLAGRDDLPLGAEAPEWNPSGGVPRVRSQP